MKAVLFDFNGTLFDDTDFHLRAWKDYLFRRFALDFSEDEVYARCVGPDNQTIFRNLFGERYSTEEIDTFSKEKEAEYRDAVRATPERMQLIDGACEALDALCARGIPIAMATASIWDNVEFYLNELGAGKWFSPDRVVYVDGKLRCKPNPDFYLEAARRLHTAPQDCVIVEDSPTGLKAAENAGAGRIIAIDRTHRHDLLADSANVYAFIHDFKDFLQYV